MDVSGVLITCVVCKLLLDSQLDSAELVLDLAPSALQDARVAAAAPEPPAAFASLASPRVLG